MHAEVYARAGYPLGLAPGIAQDLALDAGRSKGEGVTVHFPPVIARNLASPASMLACKDFM